MSLHEDSLRLDAVRRWQVPADGTLAVRRARVWITRDGDPADHVLAPGDTLALQAGDWLTLEPWQAGRPVLLQWRAAPRPLARLLHAVRPRWLRLELIHRKIRSGVQA